MKTMTILFTWILLTLSQCSMNAQSVTSNLSIEQNVEAYLSAGVPMGFSGSVLIAKKGKIILHKGYGLANKEDKLPYDVTTVSTIGSVTKQFTATAILKLEEMKKLNVEDPLSKFFSKLPNDKKDITIHQLLTHSAGFIDGIGQGDFDDIPTKRFFNSLFSTKLLYKPGTKHEYSNAGYSVLARVIEIVSGQDYELFLNQHLFQPVGMKNTGYLLPNWKGQSIAIGYAHNIVNLGNLLSRFQKIDKVTWNLKGNGGIHSTTEDMFKWYNALKENKILSPYSFEKLTAAYIPEQEKGTSHYAYGWAIYSSKRNTKIISHNGGNHIFFHDFIWLPEEDVVIILFTNASSKEVEVAWPIMKIIFENDYVAKPIKKNIYQATFDFIENNNLKKSTELITTLRKMYSPNIKNPYVLNGLGYRILKNDIIELKENAAWSIQIFKLNTELFPNDGNSWDSLGEAYLKNDQKEEAVKSYEKAMKLAPSKNCDWCKSSTKALNQLRKNK